MNAPAINPSHRYAIYEYLDNVSDPYYRGKRFISSNGGYGDTTKIVATADTTEECQQYLDHSPMALLGWLMHQNAQTGGALGRMMMEDGT